MKKTLKIAAAVLLISVFLPFNTYAAESEIMVFVDEQKMNFPDQKPFINPDNRTLVPVRFVSEALGAKVDWNSLTRTVVIAYQDKTIRLEIGLKEAMVGETPVDMNTAAVMLGNRTMVPLRFVSECLGAKVEWNQARRHVYITTAGYVSDASLVNSDLQLSTPPPWNNTYNVNLSATVQYKYTTPVEPQLADLRKLLEKRFGSKAEPVMEYISSKKDTTTRLSDKKWTIDGKLIRVDDSIGYVGITIWN